MNKTDIKILINYLKMIYDIMGSLNEMLDFLMSICVGKDFDNNILGKVLQDVLDKVNKLSKELSNYILEVKERVASNGLVHEDDLIMVNIFDSIHSNLSKSIDVIKNCMIYSILENDIEVNLELHEIYETLAKEAEYAKSNDKKVEIFNKLIDEIKSLLNDFDDLFNDIAKELDK